MIKIITLFVFLFAHPLLHAQVSESEYESTAADYDRPVDSSAVIRDYAFSCDSLLSRRQQKSYAWNKSIDSVLRARVKREEEALRNIKPGRSNGFFDFFNSAAVQFVLIGVGIVLLIFLVLKFTGAGGLFAFGPKKRRPEQLAEEVAADRDDAVSLRQSALQQGDLRSAVRYGFILLLSELAARGLIEVAQDKTNAAYQRELPPAFRAAFRTAALYYNYVWFGHAAVSQSDYKTIDAHFEELKMRRR